MELVGVMVGTMLDGPHRHEDDARPSQADASTHNEALSVPRAAAIVGPPTEALCARSHIGGKKQDNDVCSRKKRHHG